VGTPQFLHRNSLAMPADDDDDDLLLIPQSSDWLAAFHLDLLLAILFIAA